MADVESNTTEFVHIRLAGHGDDVAPGRVTRKSYENHWQAKGWQIVSEEDAALASSPESEMSAPPTTKKKG